VALFAAVREYIETLVHPSARQDALATARHRAFIAPRLLGSVIALASFPIYLLARGARKRAIFTVYFLSRALPKLNSASWFRGGSQGVHGELVVGAVAEKRNIISHLLVEPGGVEPPTS
jgi:two-component system, cell cycle sensor histidine kinase DivJ